MRIRSNEQSQQPPALYRSQARSERGETLDFMKIITTILLIALLSGCSTLRLFIPMSMTDTGKTDTGELYVKDSQRNWDDFTNGVESSFQKELRGEEFRKQSIADPNPPKTWPEWWMYSIRRIEEGKPVLYENPRRLIEYIHHRRAELGLPPVVTK